MSPLNYPTGEIDEEDILSIWQRRYEALLAARAKVTTAGMTSAKERGVIVRVGNQRFVLPLTQVVQVIPIVPEQKAVPVPGAPAAFWGLINVQGAVRPVFDLGMLLNVPVSETQVEGGHLVFVSSEGTQKESERIGLKTDRVEEITFLVPDDAEQSSSLIIDRTGFVARSIAGSPDNALLQVIDIPALLAYLRGEEEMPDSSYSVENQKELEYT